MIFDDFLMLAFITFACVIIFSKIAFYFVFFLRFRKVPEIPKAELPSVSILIPARNEQDNLPTCLESLLRLDYPSELLQIWVGNDQSKDTTREIAENYQQKYEHVRVLDIQSDYHDLTARSNVLAQLAKRSDNHLMVFLDADMEVDPQWLNEMVAPTAHGYDLVSGYTQIKPQSLLGQFQKFDWISVIMLLKAGADIKKPGTALGNNMLVSRKAYNAIGGYECIGPTFTEDNDLTIAAIKKGFHLFQIVVPGGARTQPMTTWPDLYKQRNRWMQGAFKQPLIRLIPLLLSRVFVLYTLLASVIHPGIGVSILLFFSISDVIFSLLVSEIIKNHVPIRFAIFAPVFNSVLDTFTLLSYPWNKQVVWKDRKL